jgi:hypothetical protein
MVVDHLEWDIFGGFTGQERFGATVVDLAVVVAARDRVLDRSAIQVPLLASELGMIGPDEAVDGHR